MTVTVSMSELAQEILPPHTGLEIVVYSRYEHGNLPVRVFQSPLTGDTCYEVTYGSGPNGKKRVFSSARAMISEFYGHEIHMTFDRYFRLGKYRPTPNIPGRGVTELKGQSNLLRLLDPDLDRTQNPITVHGSAKTVFQTTKISVCPPVKTQLGAFRVSGGRDVEEFFEALSEALGAPPQESELAGGLAGGLSEGELETRLEREFDRVEGLVGIDLAQRAHEVRKLLFAGFAHKMLSRGYNPEDVLQEIYRGLLVRNHGTCPWDKSKSSFGHYVYMAINCILTNYHRKEIKRADGPTNSIPLDLTQGPQSGPLVSEESQIKAQLVPESLTVQIHYGSELGDQMALNALREYLGGVPDRSQEAEIGREILPWVSMGCSRREIVSETGIKAGLVSRGLAWIRREVALWATEMGMGRTVPLKYRVS